MEDRYEMLAKLQRRAAERAASSWAAQTVAWEEELPALESAAQTLLEAGHGEARLVIEYEIPRRSKRPDAVLVTQDVLVVIEFKGRLSEFEAGARWQAIEYALDLRDFHSKSHGRGLAAVVVAGRQLGPERQGVEELGVPVFGATEETLGAVLLLAIQSAKATSTHSSSPEGWELGEYRPTLTIIQAAEELYRDHGVIDINHSYASNLTQTTDALVARIREAAKAKKRVICFVTGVPGAGKTLTGLNAVHDPSLRAEGRPAGVFLTGNGPLVRVIRAALANSGKHATRKEAERTVKTFIQSVHVFVREYVEKPHAVPPENVVVFDEGQRAWSDASQVDACIKKALVAGRDIYHSETALHLRTRRARSM